jgi:hypothetical protein
MSDDRSTITFNAVIAHRDMPGPAKEPDSVIPASNEMLCRQFAGMNVIVVHRIDMVVFRIADQHEWELIALKQVDSLVRSFRLDKNEPVNPPSP